MRFIKTTGFDPSWWKAESQRKTKAIIIASRIAGQEKAFLEVPGNKTWNKLKPNLERLSHYKCWFSESYASVSDFDVEHFRPKRGVYLIKNKDPYVERRTASCKIGYWWLSYELENFRLAGTKPNQHKGRYFPLEASSSIAKPIDNSWRREKPILLDPCVKRDTELLTYDGVEPSPADPNTLSIDHIRARVSIEIYGLKLGKLKRARSRVLGEAINYYRTAARNWAEMSTHLHGNNVAYDLAKANFEEACTNLVSMLNPKMEFTRMVLAFLSSINQTWVNDFIIATAKRRNYVS